MMGAASYTLCFHILKPKQPLRKWSLVLASAPLGRDRSGWLGFSWLSPAVRASDRHGYMTMDLHVLDGLHSSLECLKQMGKLERRMTESAPVVTHVQSAGQFLKALPQPRLVGCHLTRVVGWA